MENKITYDRLVEPGAIEKIIENGEKLTQVIQNAITETNKLMALNKQQLS